jgi:hypothetical protein
MARKAAKHAAKKSATRRKTSTRQKPLVTAVPASQHQAAVSAGMFLYTDDAWSLRYFDPNDLHCTERKLFG